MTSETDSEPKLPGLDKDFNVGANENVTEAVAAQSASDVPPESDNPKERKKRTRVNRPYPASTFEEALEFAKQVREFGSGKQVRRLALFDHIGKSPESGPSRQLVTNANKYGLIEGSYGSEFLSITPAGLLSTDDEASPRDRVRARIKLAIEDIAVFNSLYETYVGNRLPAKAALVDKAKEYGVDENSAEEAVDTFILNLRYVSLLQTLSGAERIVSRDHVLDELPSAPMIPTGRSNTALDRSSDQSDQSKKQSLSDDLCFYIAPIGADDSLERKHSDLILSSIIEPALDQFKLKVVRADAIASPGVIGKQIIDHIINSKLVVVDLSFHNPNVFYELAIRHMLRKPIVQIIRKADRIPFDISQVRTIIIDTTDIYTLVPKLELYKSEVANQVRRALEDADAADNPISLFFPQLKVETN